MASTDQCYNMRLNTDVVSAQMSKGPLLIIMVVLHVVSYYPLSYSVTEQHFFGKSKTNVSTFDNDSGSASWLLDCDV